MEKNNEKFYAQPRIVAFTANLQILLCTSNPVVHSDSEDYDNLDNFSW